MIPSEGTSERNKKRRSKKSEEEEDPVGENISVDEKMEAIEMLAQ